MDENNQDWGGEGRVYGAHIDWATTGAVQRFV